MDSDRAAPHRRASWIRQVMSVAIVLASMSASYFGLSTLLQERSLGARARIIAEDRSRDPVNPFASADGMHLIAFVITASDCGWSKQQPIMEAIRGVRTALRAKYGADYARVSVVGVALDNDPSVGMQFLVDIGGGSISESFDQVIAGGSWLNEQIVRFVWREKLTQAASPQIVLIRRPVTTSSYLATSTISVPDDELLGSVMGSSQIVQWLDDGMPLTEPLLTHQVATNQPGNRAANSVRK